MAPWACSLSRHAPRTSEDMLKQAATLLSFGHLRLALAPPPKRYGAPSFPAEVPKQEPPVTPLGNEQGGQGPAAAGNLRGLHARGRGRQVRVQPRRRTWHPRCPRPEALKRRVLGQGPILRVSRARRPQPFSFSV